MSDETSKKPVPITDAKTGQVRFSDPMPVHGGRQNAPLAMPVPMAPKPKLGNLTSPVAKPEPSGEVGMEPSQDVARPSSVSGPDEQSAVGNADEVRIVEVAKSRQGSKSKVDITTFEQFIVHAYGRKGQRVAWKPKLEQLILGSLPLDDEAVSRLRALEALDVLLEVPRQLLFVSREVEGVPSLRAELNSFVLSVMRRHSIFSADEIQAAICNLPESPAMVDALGLVAAWNPEVVEGGAKLKQSELQSLRRNAVHLLTTWFVCNRGLNIEESSALLSQVLWMPAARDLADDNARLRVLTEIEQPAGLGLVSHRLRQQANEARFGQEQAQREAERMKEKILVLEAQLKSVQLDCDALARDLEMTRLNSTNELSELRTQQESERMHMRHELEQLRGRLVRRLDESVDMLEVGLTALRNKTPRTEVMAERAEHVVDALRAESTNLKEE